MQPMLATRGDHVPSGSEWIHEVKWDGIRALVDVHDGRARVFSRNENDISAGFPELSGLGGAAGDVVLDGEIVALGDGVPSFGAIVERIHLRDRLKVAQLAEERPATFLIFDVLRLDGEDLFRRPLSERRSLLVDLGLADVSWQVPATYDDGAMLLEAAKAQKLEGIVSKRLSSLYYPGRRTTDWLKFPIRPTGSFVVGGYRHETGSDARLGAVLVGQPGPDGLRFRGRVGSGLAGKAGQRLGELLRPLAAESSPFSAELPRPDRDGTVWVRPEVIVDVEYLVLTRDGRLRQPSYRGVRADLDVGDLEGGEDG